MWNYIETDAYHSITLHDCRTEDIQIDGDDLFPGDPRERILIFQLPDYEIFEE